MSTENRLLLAVLMTCHNRRELTLAAIRALPAALQGAARHVVYLVDDGSTDGTADAVSQEFPEVKVLRGNGDLYWNGGMRLAWQAALDSKPDFFLWLNDDLELRPGAIAGLLDLHSKYPTRTLVVGKTVDPSTGAVTYGGYKRARGASRLRFCRLSEEEQECLTMNGNCVLIPGAAAAEIGINSEQYRHAFGDNDYGLRARRNGYTIIEMKKPVGYQQVNHRYKDSISRLSWRNWRFVIFHPKGIPVREWLYFCRQFGGPLWPINFVWRYAKIARFS